jgi:hypothetical protein
MKASEESITYSPKMKYILMIRQRNESEICIDGQRLITVAQEHGKQSDIVQERTPLFADRRKLANGISPISRKIASRRNQFANNNVWACDYP